MANWKRKYWKIRKEFKKELYEVVKKNKVYIPMIAETYAAHHHKSHIYKAWYLMIGYPDFRKRYNQELMGKTLCGRNEILLNLHYADDRFAKYRGKLPERLAMGDALAIAYRVQAENRLEA